MVIQCLGLVPLSPGPWPLEFNLTTFLSEKVSCNTILAGCVARVPVSLRGSGLGVQGVFAGRCICVRNRLRPSATARNCSQLSAWGPYKAEKLSLLEISNVPSLRLAWQASLFVTFQHVSQRIENRFVWQARYFCVAFNQWVTFLVAGAAFWKPPSKCCAARAARFIRRDIDFDVTNLEVHGKICMKKNDFVETASRLRHFSNRFWHSYGFDMVSKDVACNRRKTFAWWTRVPFGVAGAVFGSDPFCVASAVFPTVHCKFHTLHLTLRTEHSTLLHFRLRNPLFFALTPHPTPHSTLQGSGMATGKIHN